VQLFLDSAKQYFKQVLISHASSPTPTPQQTNFFIKTQFPQKNNCILSFHNFLMFFEKFEKKTRNLLVILKAYNFVDSSHLLVQYMKLVVTGLVVGF
jgi:hypothetical protein